MRAHRCRYWVSYAWTDRLVERALMGFPLITVFGWQARWEGRRKRGERGHLAKWERSAKNFMAQAHGAEILREAVFHLSLANIRVAALVHDAVLIEAPIGQIDADVETTRRILSDASETVLGPGYCLRTDAEVIRYPNRFVDKRGVEMWDWVMEALKEAEAEDRSFETSG